MAKCLLFVILICFICKIQTKDPPPKLTVYPPVISAESDSVTLNCDPPSSVFVSQCYFGIGEESIPSSSCQKTLTVTELLAKTRQSSPAEVKVKCFYTVRHGEVYPPSLHSSVVSIQIQSQPPQMSVQHFKGENVAFVCSLPGSANRDTTCHLYFGDKTYLAAKSNLNSRTTKNKQWFCQFYVTISDLLRHLYPYQQSHASCDYTLGSEPSTLSPRSERYNLADIVESESSRAPTQPTLTPTTGTSSTSKLQHRTSIRSTSVEDTVEVVSQRTNKEPKGLPVGSTSIFLSTSQTPVGAQSDTMMLIFKIIVGVACFGVAVGVIFLGRALTRKGRCFYKRTRGNVSSDFIYMDNVGNGGLVRAGKDQTSDVIAPEPDAVCPADTKNLDRKSEDNEEEYHVYCTIPDEPSPRAPNDNVYSLLQAH